MKGLLIGVACLSLLAGCADPGAQQLRAQVSQCKAQFAFEKGTAREQSVCLRDAVQTWGKESPDQDYYYAQRVLVGGEVDSGQMSADAAAAQLLGLKAQLIQNEQANAAQEQAARAQSLAATAAIMQATTPPPPVYAAPVFQPVPAPVITNCQSFGNQTSCLSH